MEVGPSWPLDMDESEEVSAGRPLIFNAFTPEVAEDESSAEFVLVWPVVVVFDMSPLE